MGEGRIVAVQQGNRVGHAIYYMRRCATHVLDLPCRASRPIYHHSSMMENMRCLHDRAGEFNEMARSTSSQVRQVKAGRRSRDQVRETSPSCMGLLCYSSCRILARNLHAHGWCNRCLHVRTCTTSSPTTGPLGNISRDNPNR